MISDKIVSIAKGYIGQKEIAGNNGFLDKKFDQEIKDMGFEKGQSWCSYFAELVFKKAYLDDPKKWNMLDKLFSANAVRTFENFEKSKQWIISKVPSEGCLVVWMNYSNNKPKEIGKGWFAGHIGIVSKITKTGFMSVEGNTNDEGGREGIEVAEKTRTLSWKAKDGLRLIGFVKPM